MKVAGAVVLNLPRRTDRLENFLARWRNTGLTIPLTVIAATDQTLADPDDPRWVALPCGAWGCWDTHIRALAQSIGPVLVCEDDAVFCDHFAQALDTIPDPPGWEVLHLGGQHLITPAEPRPHLARPVLMLRTHAYIARFPQVLARALRTRRTHVDRALNQLPLNRWCADPWLVGQDDTPSDITRHTAPLRVEFWNGDGR